MINKITLNSTNVSFKNKLTEKERASARSNSYVETYRKQTNLGIASLFLGLGAGDIAKLRGKTPAKALAIGVGVYFATNILGLLALGRKEIKDSNEFYKDYDDKNNDGNFLDKFLNKISSPPVVDFGDEEKNKEYYQKEKADRKKANTISLLSLGVGSVAALGTGIICAIKKAPEKFDKIVSVASIAALGSLIAGNVIESKKDK